MAWLTRRADRFMSFYQTKLPSTFLAAIWLIRLDRLRAIGGFDPRFKIAGDDVDICWRLQERGWTLGFSPAAVVWHHQAAIDSRILEATEGICESRGLSLKNGRKNTTKRAI